MDEQTPEQPESSPELALYEQLYQKLYAYQFGTIDFLELIESFEEILRIQSQSDQGDTA